MMRSSLRGPLVTRHLRAMAKTNRSKTAPMHPTKVAKGSTLTRGQAQPQVITTITTITTKTRVFCMWIPTHITRTGRKTAHLMKWYRNSTSVETQNI